MGNILKSIFLCLFILSCGNNKKVVNKKEKLELDFTNAIKK